MLAGREVEQHEILLGLRRGPSTDQFHHLILGGRGVGKTALLQQLRQYVADEWSWSSIAWVAGNPDWSLHRAVADEEGRVMRELDSVARRVGRSLRPDTVSAGVSVASASKTLKRTDQPSMSLVTLLRRLAGRAGERRRGLVLVVDELQNGQPGELAGMSAAIQLVSNQEGLPVALLAAGLSDTPRVLRGAKATYIERQDKLRLSNLDPGSTRDALEVPFVRAGRRISPAALALLVAACDGYPYAIQLHGKFTWESAGDRDGVTLDDARRGAVRAADRLVDNVYEGRWEDLTPRERRYLAAYLDVASGRGGARTGDIAARLGGLQTDWSQVRNSLINVRHLLRQSRRGAVALDIPGFGEWLDANRLDLEVPMLDSAPRTPHELPRGLGR